METFTIAPAATRALWIIHSRLEAEVAHDGHRVADFATRQIMKAWLSQEVP